MAAGAGGGMPRHFLFSFVTRNCGLPLSAPVGVTTRNCAGRRACWNCRFDVGIGLNREGCRHPVERDATRSRQLRKSKGDQSFFHRDNLVKKACLREEHGNWKSTGPKPEGV